MAKKKIDLADEIKKAEDTLMGTRLTKLNQLVNAKEEHDKAVKKAHDDETKAFQEMLKSFAERVPQLSQLAEKVSKLAELPEIPIPNKEEKMFFGAHEYRDLGNNTRLGIGIRIPPVGYGEAHRAMLDCKGSWITYKMHKSDFSCDDIRDTDNAYDRRHHANSKEFMLAALEWEKQLIALVDSL